MAPNKNTQRLLRYRADGRTLLQALIIELLQHQPMYLAELREVLDANAGSLNRAVNQLIKKGVVEKIHKPAPPEQPRGAPKSALVRLV